MVLYLSIAFNVGSLDNLGGRLFSEQYSGIVKFLIIVEKKLLRVFASSTSLDVMFSLFTKVIFSLDFI